MTTNNLLILIMLLIVYLIFKENNQKKSIKNKELKVIKTQNKVLKDLITEEQEKEIERRKKELARINMLEKRNKELAWRIELLTRLKYIRRLRRIRKKYNNGYYRRRAKMIKKIKKVKRRVKKR